MMKGVVGWGGGGWSPTTLRESWGGERKKKSTQQTALRFPSSPLYRCLMKSARPRIIVVFFLFFLSFPA